MKSVHVCVAGRVGCRGRTPWAYVCWVVGGLLGIHSAIGATVSLKAFDRLATTVELEYIQSGTSEIHRLPMERQVFGVWQVDFSVSAGSYEYRFVTDGEWISDISHPALNRWDDGSVWSLFSVPGEESHFSNYRKLEKSVNEVAGSVPDVSSNGAMEQNAFTEVEWPENRDDKGEVTFQFYAPLASEVAVVGTFNQWNGEQNRLSRKGKMWTCSIPLDEGTYEYKFKVDGNWLWDPERPPQAPGENSVITVKRPPPASATSHPLIQAELWKDVSPILLEPATGLHAFQQELMRAYLYIVGSDHYKLKIADGSLLNPDTLPTHPAARWGWSIDSSSGLSMMVLTVNSNTAAFELKHPLLDPPLNWLSKQRLQAETVFGDVSWVGSGPKEPPANSAWAMARAELAKRCPFSGVYAINRMTEFGRQEGWSPELLREMAVTYADLSIEDRYPGIGGWAPMVFAARAVVYADLARSGDPTDETLAYVLCRIGRPGDGAIFLPATPKTFHGRLAAAMARGEMAPLLKWAGSSDHYGLNLIEGQSSHAPRMDGFTTAQKVQILSALSDVYLRDGQENLSRCYLDGALELAPYDFAGRVRALERGGVSAGHLHAGSVLRLGGNIHLWRSVLQGGAPILQEKPKAQWPFWAFRPTSHLGVTEETIAEIAALYQEKQHEGLDVSSEAIPPAARLLLLRDMLNMAWWRNARFYGVSYYIKDGCRRLNKLMAAWKPLQPEMESFTRFVMTGVMDDHDYGAIRRNFTDSSRKPDTLDYIHMVRSAYRTWLMDKAQSFYPLVLTVQSDLFADYQTGEEVYVFQNRDQVRANYRRLDPMSPAGYPAPGPLPKPEAPGTVPEVLFNHSYGLNRKLAGEWSRTFDKESQEAAMAFFKRCMRISPYEIELRNAFADILMDNGEYAEVISLAESCPDTMEGLERAAMYRMGAYAALELGDTERALTFSKAAADTWQSRSMEVYAYVLEITGDVDESEKVLQAVNERYDDNDDIYLLARQLPEKAEERANEILSWLEQFPDLNQANNENRFSFNALKDAPYIYASVDRWDRALWLFKPLAEAVQNDFIWFGLMAVGQKTGDNSAMELGQHVLATHVFNAWGDFARFMRNQTTWEEVLNAARNNNTPHPMYYLAAVIAEQRGDSTLAARLYKQTLDPRFTTGPWFTMAWRALQRLGHDPMTFVRRNFSEKGQTK